MGHKFSARNRVETALVNYLFIMVYFVSNFDEIAIMTFFPKDYCTLYWDESLLVGHKQVILVLASTNGFALELGPLLL